MGWDGIGWDRIGGVLLGRVEWSGVEWSEAGRLFLFLLYTFVLLVRLVQERRSLCKVQKIVRVELDLS